MRQSGRQENLTKSIVWNSFPGQNRQGFSAARQEIPSWAPYMRGSIALRPVATVEPTGEIGGNNEQFQGVRQRPQPS